MSAVASHRPHRGGLVPYLKFLSVTLLIAALEIIGGIITGSLSLISDAVGHAPIHMAAGGLAIMSYLMAGRRTETENHRRETRVRMVIAGLILLGAAQIAREGVGRLWHPHEIDGWWVSLIAFFGFIGNFYQKRLLMACDCALDRALRSDVYSDIVMSGAVVLNGVAIGLGAPVVVDTALSLAAVVWISVIAVLLFRGKHAH